MRQIWTLSIRNLKLYFKDKGLFISSLITPIILLVLYATFLSKVYKDSFLSAIPEGFNLSDNIIESEVASQLVASLLAVSCITIAFCSNLIMIQDKANLTIEDLTVTPVKKSVLAISYFLSSLLSTLIITMTTLVLSLLYLQTKGCYLGFVDVVKIIGDVILLTLFGTSLSSCVNFFLSTEGAASAVGTIVSSMYGFICGAYMQINSFGKGLQNILSFLPGTYATSLIKYDVMNPTFVKMSESGLPIEYLNGLKKSIDADFYFNNNLVTNQIKIIVLVCSILVFLSVFIVFNIIQKKKNTK
jgi:multidrug/hemolysin transport system permease protein